MDGPQAVVVGAGPNGLVAAVVLAGLGWQVSLLEAAQRPGGGLATEELTLPGFRHDVCSAVHPLAQVSPVLTGLGLEQEGLRWAHPPLPLAHPVHGGPAALLHRSLEQTVDDLGDDGPAWARLVGPVVGATQALVHVLLARQIPWRELRPPQIAALARFGLTGVVPVSVIARTRLHTPAAQALLGGVAAHSALPLGAAATTGYGLLLAGLAHAVGWPVAVGGSQALADALVARLVSLGGRVQTGRRVDSLAELPPADAVLLDLTPRQVLAVGGDRLPTRYAAALRRYRYGPGVFKVDWALDGPVPWADPVVAGAGTVHLGGELREVAAAERAVSEGRLPTRPFVIAGQPSVADPSRAPAGQHTAWAYCHVPAGCGVDMTEAIEAQVERFAPGFRERILARHVLAPHALAAHDANLVGGDIMGGLMSVRQLVARPVLRRAPWRTPVPGVYLCSAATPPGGGVHGMAGWRAAMTADADHPAAR